MPPQASQATNRPDDTPTLHLNGWLRKLNNGNWQERAEAAKYLAASGPNVVCDLVVAIRSEQREVRYAAAWALGEIGGEQSVTALCEALGDRHWSVREVAAHALGHIADRRARKPLLSAMQDECRSVRNAAATALEHLGVDWRV